MLGWGLGFAGWGWGDIHAALRDERPWLGGWGWGGVGVGVGDDDVEDYWQC